MKHDISYSKFSEERVASVRELFVKYSDSLSEYADRLLWWNEKINLVSRDVPRETVLNHIEHSLAISQVDFFKSAREVIDSGTGGGLPGIPLAITSPGKRILLNDIVSKKIMACKHMATGLGLENTESVMGSVENMEIRPDSIIISKHAFKINELMDMIGDEPWSGVILLKGGKEVENELSGVKTGLKISVIDLEENFKNLFYEGKAIVEILRKKEK